MPISPALAVLYRMTGWKDRNGHPARGEEARLGNTPEIDIHAQSISSQPPHPATLQMFVLYSQQSSSQVVNACMYITTVCTGDRSNLRLGPWNRSIGYTRRTQAGISPIALLLVEHTQQAARIGRTRNRVMEPRTAGARARVELLLDCLMRWATDVTWS